ncbi:alpha-L-glutamate ligase, partial [Streptomyces amritsarensis]
MRIGLITPEPGHPLLADTTALLTPEHEVEALDPITLGDVPLPLADVYLLKSRTPHALGLARYLERRGAPVVNTASATALCQDRTEMAGLALRAGLPFAATRTVGALGAWASRARPSAPVVVKSRRSRRRPRHAPAPAPPPRPELAPGAPPVAGGG